MNEIMMKIANAKDDAERIYRENKTDWNAGRYDGLKQALELIEREIEHT